MNWMIDGAYGNDYRIATGKPLQIAAIDEWELERRKSLKPARKRHALRARLRLLRRIFRPYGQQQQQQINAAVMEGFVS